MHSVMKLNGEIESTGSPQKAKRTRRAVACDCCRLRKVKCDGGRPKCRNCLVRNQTCVYGRGRRSLATSVLCPEYPPTSTTGRDTDASRSRPGVGFDSSEPYLNQPFCEAEALPSLSNITSRSIANQEYPLQNIPGDGRQSEVNIGGSPDIGLDGLGTAEQSKYPSPPMEESASNIAPPEHEHWEYHGPGSYLSICSKPGVQWVVDQSGIPDFTNTTRSFSREISHVLKLDHPLGLQRTPQPDEETAWRYVRVFFDELPEAVFGIVLREPFEARFRAYCRDSRSSTAKEYNSEWYALRNIVWAYSARALHDKSQYASSTFIEASQAGTQYLENALSRLPDLLCCRCSLTAIEALILMALYAEGVGCPSIEYTLCSDALRLAYSKGLHRQPGTAWGISPEEVEHRNTLFWVIYFYEKHIAYRSGRPSTIDDNDISCHLPARVSYSSEFCWFAFKHAQISSQIAKRFHTVRAYSQSADACVKTATELEKKLTEWNETIPAGMKHGTLVDSTEISMHLHHPIYLHCAYYGSLISIHSVFTNPWSPIYAKCQTGSLRKQVKRSSNIVADASRNIILATRYVNDMLAGTPIWLAMYYPILGLINLFVHILRNPHASTVRSDIALLDVVTGHLARLEFASGGTVAFSFAREVSKISREAVRNAGLRQDTQNATPTVWGNLDMSVNEGEGEDQDMLTSENLGWDDANFLDFDATGDYDIENWSTLLPIFGLEGVKHDYKT